ncbi:hypothetical protein RUM43_012202 [Polyplax serrata]|uniref:Uncharacterized protein n=1 Tax=Polyplax serrata TaxID=468196 RepID=A0AAN8NKA3_POLSC
MEVPRCTAELLRTTSQLFKLYEDVRLFEDFHFLLMTDQVFLVLSSLEGDELPHKGWGGGDSSLYTSCTCRHSTKFQGQVPEQVKMSNDAQET